MRRVYILFGMFLMIGSTFAQDQFGRFIFSARLDTIQEVGIQAGSSSGNGVAGFKQHDDTLWFDITVNGLTGPIVGSHIHSGMAGSNGPIVYDLTPFIDRNKIKGFLTGISFEDGQLQKFLDGGYYVNVHTAMNPSGEIRGQIWPETDYNYGALLSLAEAGNPGTDANGFASFNLSLNHNKLEVGMLVTGLSGTITNAHLHYGAPGVSGPAIIPLMPYNQGNTFQGVVDLTTLADQQGFLDSLSQGKVYVNVHTLMYPAGEIRGQLYMNRTVSFDNWMTSAQETGNVDPGTPASARGFCNVTVNSSNDTLWVNAQADQLSGPIAGAHFHMGQPGQSGPVEVDLTPFITGSEIYAVLTENSPQFTGTLNFHQFVKEALNGNIYVNFHTALNPAGEVRGQVSTIVREGLIYSLCQSQETGTVLGPGSGQGSGFVSMDRNYSNLHWGMAAANLSSEIMGAHFHHAVKGENGPIIYSLPTDTVMTGFWDDPSFTETIADQFENGEIYNNFHTTLNPSGEIRGQLANGDFCTSSTGIGTSGKTTTIVVSVSPNPVRSVSTLTVTLPKDAQVSLKLFNILGTKINTLLQGELPAGEYSRQLEASDLPNGLYYYSLVVNGDVARTGKVIISK